MTEQKKHKYAQTREELLMSLIKRQTPRAVIELDGKTQGISRCVFFQMVNGGCAIGSQVLPSLAAKLTFENWEDMIPERLRKMGKKFLRHVMSIHDEEINWVKSPKPGEIVWNSVGKKALNQVILEYKLNIKLLK